MNAAHIKGEKDSKYMYGSMFLALIVLAHLNEDFPG